MKGKMRDVFQLMIRFLNCEVTVLASEDEAREIGI